MDRKLFDDNRKAFRRAEEIEKRIAELTEERKDLKECEQEQISLSFYKPDKGRIPCRVRYLNFVGEARDAMLNAAIRVIDDEIKELREEFAKL